MQQALNTLVTKLFCLFFKYLFLIGDALPPVDPNRMRLYIMRFCPYAHRTRLALEHKKIP